MGGNVSLTPEEQEARLLSNKERHQNAKEFEHAIKILVLGALRSGKSTLMKQMNIIYGDGYKVDKLNSYKSEIHINLLTFMKVVVRAMNKLRIPCSDPSNEDHTSAILDLNEYARQISPQLEESLKMIIHDKGFQECFRRAYEYELSDSAPYYFQEMERILGPGYTPNEQDVLRVRIPTTGIIETSFKVGLLTYRLVEVSGDRTERRKWIRCFDNAQVIIYIAAINGYDMTLLEDGATNRLEESLNLFQAICDYKFLKETLMILFLNKMDLFEEKIMRSVRHLRLYFPEYTGPDRNVEAAAKFIQDQFQARNMNKDKLIYPHFITATDTNNIRDVFKVVFKTIIDENLQAAILL